MHGQTDYASRFGPMAANFASGLEPFKHLLRVTVYPHILALELRVPMGLAALAPRKIASHPLHLVLAHNCPYKSLHSPQSLVLAAQLMMYQCPLLCQIMIEDRLLTQSVKLLVLLI